jgi:small subunit ribosomal protein S1
VQAAIRRIDPENRRLSLGIKQLQPDAWESFFQNHAISDVVRGKVTRHASFGLFVEVAEGVEGLCHNSEVPAGETLAAGQESNFKIIKLNPAEKKIGLSLRAAEEEEQAGLERYNQQAASAGSTIEEVLSFKEREEK